MSVQLPAPFDSRKLWIAAVSVGALAALGATGHADNSVVAAIVAIGGGGVGTQGVLDYKAGGSSPTDKAP